MTTTTPTNDDMLTLLMPRQAELNELISLAEKIYQDQQTNPEFNFQDYEKDINHLFMTICQQYTDMSCVHLHTDELMGEAYLKFSSVFDRGYFNICKTRKDFFARLKTVINNHIKGLVQRYRFTIKRTGIKPPPKGQVPTTPEDFRSTKPVEISLDDPESLVQVSEPEAPRHIDDDMALEIRRTLTPLEELVFDQLIAPNTTTWMLAEMDAERGGNRSDSIKVTIKKAHIAEGIGLDLDTFLAVERAVKKKVDLFMTLDKDPEALEQEAQFNAALSKLCEVFGLQVPKGIERVTIRRAMTLAARRNFDKLDDVVKSALIKIGAKVPESNGLSLNCLGVLFDVTNKICSICGHRERCRVDAATLGLDKIIPHPTVLGVRQMRIPTLITETTPPQPPVPNERNDGILSYLNETFAQSIINRDTYYRHREAPDGRRPPQIFCVITSQPSEHIKLRFCNPNEDLTPRLEKRRNGWYLPDNTPVEEALELIEQHSSWILEHPPGEKMKNE